MVIWTDEGFLADVRKESGINPLSGDPTGGCGDQGSGGGTPPDLEDPPYQPWESFPHRFRIPPDLRQRIGASNSAIAVPRNVVAHIQDVHPRDMHVLDNIQAFIDAYEYTESARDRDDKVVVYSHFEDVWRRAVVVRGDGHDAPNLLVSLYRRDARKGTKAIDSGRLRRRKEK